MGELQPRALADFFPPGCSLPTIRGGSAVVNLVRARLNRGWATDVLTLDPQATAPLQRFDAAWGTLWIIQRRPYRCIRDAFRTERRLIHQAIQLSDAQICHAHWTYEYGLAAVLQTKMPYVVTVRDHAGHILRWVGIKYIGLFLITQFVVRQAKNRITAVSPYIADYISRKTKQFVPVIPNVTSDLVLKCKKQSSTKNNKAIILTIADSGRLKNVKRALVAFRQFSKLYPNYEYHLIGAGLESTGLIAAWATKHHLHQQVIFRGVVPYAEVLNTMRTAKVVFHPSLEESFGNAVADALAMGIPVVGTSQAKGVRWLLDEGRAGVMVSGYSVDEMTNGLARAIEGYFTDEGFKRVEILCGAEFVLASYEEIYEKVFQGR